MPRTARVVAGSLLALALIVGPAVAPAVVSVPSASAAEGAPYIPSPTKWRAWMVNVLSSVLGAATPNKYKAEQIANAYKYDGGFETLNQKFGIDGIRMNEAGQITGVKYTNKGTGTYTDVVIAGLEESYKKQSVVGKGPVRAPATPVKNLVKTVGAAGVVYLSYEAAAALGGGIADLVGGFLGFDANGLVCSATGYEEGFVGDMQRAIFTNMAGQDCSQWDFDNAYVVNVDASKSYTAATIDGRTVSVLSVINNASTTYICLNANFTPTLSGTPTGVNYRIVTKNSSGQYAAVASNSELVIGYCKTAGLATTNYTWNILTMPNATYPDAPRVWVQKRDGSAVLGYSNEMQQSNDDPDRNLKCTVTYTDGSTASALSDTFRESAGAAPVPVCPDTPAGKTPDSVKLDQQTGGQTTPLYDEPVTDEYKDWWSQYPECRGGACALDLLRLAPSPAVSCFDLDAGCPDWASDPNKADNYVCRYGTHNVALEECNLYAGIFQPGRLETEAPYSDPSTGEWSGGKNAPAQRNQSMQRTLQDPTNIRSCDFQDVGFDPVGWVLRGGQCLTEWAFVARPAVVEAHAAGVAESWHDTGPGAVISAVSGWSFSAPAGGCGGLTIPWSTILGHGVPDWNLLNACPGSPLQPAATASMVVLSISAVLGLIWSVTASFGGVSGFRGLAGGRGDN